MKSKLLITAISAVFIGLSLFFVYYGKIWTDEYWYYSGSVFVSQGKNLHYDFFSHHNPIYFFLYAIPQYSFGPSLLAGRLTSCILTLFIFLAIISINLAVINLLPIGALDGGQLLFETIEAIIRRKIPEVVRFSINLASWFFILGLIIFLSYQDIISLILRWTNR